MSATTFPGVMRLTSTVGIKMWPAITLLFVSIFVLAAAMSVMFNGVVVHSSIALAFEIITHNLSALLVITVLAFVSVGLLGGLVIAFNGMSFGYLLVTPAIWAFAVLEVVSFCMATSVGTALSVDCLAWLRGRRSELPSPRQLFAGARLLGIACIGVVLAGVLETIVISTTGVGK